MLEIPLFNTKSADFTQTIDLDNITVTIRLTYNVRVAVFFMSIETENNSLTSMKCILEYPILYPHRALFPELPGDFFLIKVTNANEVVDFSYENFGTVYKLFYYDAEEVATWESENGL